MKTFIFASVFALAGISAQAAQTDISCVSKDRSENVQIVLVSNQNGKVIAVSLSRNGVQATNVRYGEKTVEGFVLGRSFGFTGQNETQFSLEIKDRGDNAYATASALLTQFPPMMADVDPRKTQMSCAASTF